MKLRLEILILQWIYNIKEKKSSHHIISYTAFGQTNKSFNPLNDVPISTPERAKSL